MYALACYVTSLSVVLAGFWLWDISVPAKLVGIGLTIAILVFAYEQVEYFLTQLLTKATLIEARLRVIERALELQRMEPQSTESASLSVAEQLEQERRSWKFWERVHPSWIDRLIGLLILGIAASVLAWLWIKLYWSVLL